MRHFLLYGTKVLAVLVFAAVCLTGCQEKTLSDYSYEMKDGKIMAFDGIVPYDGSVWTDDGTAACLTFSDGELQTIEYFTTEMKCYCKMNVTDVQKTFFNGAGAELQEGTFRHLYRDQYIKWKETEQAIWEVFTTHLTTP